MASPLDKALHLPFPEEVQSRKCVTKQKTRASPYRQLKNPEIATLRKAEDKQRRAWVSSIIVIVVATLIASAKLFSKDTIEITRPLSQMKDQVAFDERLVECGENCTKETVAAIARDEFAKISAEQARLWEESLVLQKTAAKLPAALAEIKELREEIAGAKKQVVSAQRLSKEFSALERQAEMSRASAVAAEKELASWKDVLGTLKKLSAEQQEKLNAVSGKGEACWQSLNHAKDRLRNWQWRCTGLTLVVLVLGGAIFSSYMRWMQRKLWRLTSEKARLSAALKIAQVGVRQRVVNALKDAKQT